MALAHFEPSACLVSSRTPAFSPAGGEIFVSAPFQTVGNVQYAGAIYVYEKPKSGWRNFSDYSAELTASDLSQPPYAGGLNGTAVSVNGGKILAAGWNINFQNPEYVFVKGSTGWQSMTQTDEILESNGNPLGAAGLSGNFICAGSLSANVNGNAGQGAAFVFQFQ